MEEMTGRVQWIDIAKGIVILMVLFGHSTRDEMRAVSRIPDYSYRCVSIPHSTDLIKSHNGGIA